MMNVLELSQPGDYHTISVEHGQGDDYSAEIEGYGDATDAVFVLRLTGSERLLLAAALLRVGETVTPMSDGSAIVEVKGGGKDER